DYREEFQKEPVVWTVGALSAGFAAGYTVGYSHKVAQSKKGSQVANFADTVVNDLSRLGQRLVLPELNAKITELFGFNFGGFLQQIGGTEKHTRTKRLQRRRRQKQQKGGRKKSSEPIHVRRLRIAQGSERLRLMKAISSDLPFFQGETQRLA